MDVGVDLGPDFDDLAFGGDEEGFAVCVVHWTEGLHRNSIQVDDFMVGVGEQLEVEGVLCAPGFVVGDGVEANAQDYGVQSVIFIEVALKVVRFDGAALGLVFRVEVEDNPLALVVG